MAALTLTGPYSSPSIIKSVVGDQQKVTANIAGPTGSTWSLNFASLIKVDLGPGSLVTSVSVAGTQPLVITFNSSNTMNEVVSVWCR